MLILDSLRLSVRFLTQLPLADRGEDGPECRRWAVAWFPLVGVVVGAPLYGAMLLPVPAVPRAAIVLALWIALTGGLHEDGWADSLDAAFALVTKERRLEILKDPHVGAHGLTGTVLLQLLRFSALTVVPPVAVLTALVVGRWVMAMSLAIVRPARSEGLGARFASDARPAAPTLVAVLLMAGIAALASPARVMAAWAAGALTALAFGRFLSQRFGGLTGDGHGAVGLLAEVAALWAFVPLASRSG